MKKELWINGQCLPGEKSVIVRSPFDGQSIGEFAVASKVQISLALKNLPWAFAAF